MSTRNPTGREIGAFGALTRAQEVIVPDFRDLHGQLVTPQWMEADQTRRRRQKRNGHKCHQLGTWNLALNKSLQCAEYLTLILAKFGTPHG